MTRQQLTFVLYGLLVAYLSLRQGSGMVIEPWDKVGHFGVYALFAVLGYWAFGRGRWIGVVCLAIIAYSSLLEVGQYFTPGRTLSGLDLLANTLGVISGAVLGKALFRVQDRRLARRNTF